jgi:predicted peptidase
MQKKCFGHSVTLLLLFFTICGTAYGQVLTGKSIAIDTNCHGYYEYLPAGYEQGDKKYPLLIILHGMGELGNGESELSKILRNGPMKLIANKTFPESFTVKDSTFKFIVFAPQFLHWPWPGTVNAIIDYAVSLYNVDRRRIYLSGLSMGGGATWECVGNSRKYAGMIAAIVPVCGASLADSVKADIIAGSNLPVWATHNQSDPVVTVMYTDKYISYINAAPSPPATPARKTIFSDPGHNAWSKTYDPAYKENGMNVYEWMLSHHR